MKKVDKNKSIVDKLEIIFKEQKKLQDTYLSLQKIINDSGLKNDASLMQLAETLINANESCEDIAFYLFIQQAIIQVEAAIRREQHLGE